MEVICHSPPARCISPVRVEKVPCNDCEEEIKHYSSLRNHGSRKLSPPPRILSPPRVKPQLVISRPEAKPLAIVDMAEALKDFLLLERELESAKQALAYRYDFTLHDAFKIFDLGAVGNIEHADVKEAFAIHGLHISPFEADLIMLRYDMNGDGVLSFPEFAELFLPRGIAASDALSERSALYPNGYYFEPGLPDSITRNEFVNVLTLVLKVENFSDFIHQRFARKNRIPSMNSYKHELELEHIRHDFKALLADFDFVSTDHEAHNLALRFDSSLF